MFKQLLENIKINLKFYRRDRLLPLIALALLILFLIISAQSLFFISTAGKFKIIKGIFSQFNAFAMIITVLLGLITIPYHIKNRCVKMVITKPCTPETWVLSNFLSAIFVGFILHILVLVIVLILFLVWHIPVQWGIFYISAENLLTTILIFSYITFLTAIMQPGIGIMVVLFFEASTFYRLVVLTAAGLTGTGSSILKLCLSCIRGVVYSIYMLLPIYSPFSDKTRGIHSSFRVSAGDFKYLFYAFAYTLTVSVFFYFLTVYFIKKKRHI